MATHLVTLFLTFSALFWIGGATHENFSQNQTTGYLQTPNYPNNYSNDLLHTYFIEAREGWAIALTIEDFQTQYPADYLKIYQTYVLQGESYSTVHAILSGTVSNGTKYITCISGDFYLRFMTSKSDVTDRGFRLSFQRFDSISGPAMNLYPCPEFRLKVEESPKLLPAISNHLGVGSNCVFEINSGSPAKFDLEAINPSVEMHVFADQKYEIAGSSYTTLSRRDVQLPFSLTASVIPLIVIIFVTSDQVADEEPYRMTFEQADPCACSGDKIELGTMETTLLLLDYSDEYCKRRQCFTTIMPFPDERNDTHLQVEFYGFAATKIHHLVEFHEFGRKLKALSPFEEEPENMIRTFTFSSCTASINYTMDERFSRNGISLSVRQIKVKPECECPNQHGIYLDQSGIFTFSLPCHSMDCFWEISPENIGKTTQLELIVNFNLDLPSEFIEIFDDHDAGPNRDLPSEFAEVFDDQEEGLHVKTIRLTNAMTSNDDSGKRTIKMNTTKSVKIWYHADNAKTNLTKQSMINVQYDWITGSPKSTIQNTRIPLFVLIVVICGILLAVWRRRTRTYDVRGFEVMSMSTLQSRVDTEES